MRENLPALRQLAEMLPKDGLLVEIGSFAAESTFSKPTAASKRPKSIDQLFFDQLTETAIRDERLRQAAQVNPEDKFSLVFTNLLEALMLERMDQNEAIVARYMGDREFQRQVAIRLAKEAYQRLGNVADQTRKR